MPDICSALLHGRSTGKTYKQWCQENLSFNNIAPDDLWSMRCGALHQGRFDDLSHGVSRVFFVLPDGRGNGFHDCKTDGNAFLQSADTFYQTMTNAAHLWVHKNFDQPAVKANLLKLMRQGELPITSFNGEPLKVIG